MADMIERYHTLKLHVVPRRDYKYGYIYEYRSASPHELESGMGVTKEHSPS